MWSLLGGRNMVGCNVSNYSSVALNQWGTWHQSPFRPLTHPSSVLRKHILVPQLSILSSCYPFAFSPSLHNVWKFFLKTTYPCIILIRIEWHLLQPTVICEMSSLLWYCIYMTMSQSQSWGSDRDIWLWRKIMCSYLQQRYRVMQLIPTTTTTTSTTVAATIF